jgi:mono/diheme cytochrome c family protein
MGELRRNAIAVAGLAACVLIGAAAYGRPAPARPDAAAGKTVYASNCVACHGEDGAGTPTGQALNAPDLRSDAVQKASDADLKQQVMNGKNNMPPFKDTLKPAEVDDVIAYVRTFAHKK